MEILNALNQEFIQIMKEEPGVLGTWEFGSGMHHTRDEYSDIDIVFFDKTGAVSSLIGTLPPGKSLQVTGLPQEYEAIARLIDTYWLHIYMTAKYFLRKDYFKLEGVLRILMDTHIPLVSLI